jgi:hypothetical protein
VAQFREGKHPFPDDGDGMVLADLGAAPTISAAALGSSTSQSTNRGRSSTRLSARLTATVVLSVLPLPLATVTITNRSSPHRPQIVCVPHLGI